MRLSLVQRIQPGYSPQVLAAVLGDVERQVNNLTEGKVQAVTNAHTAAPTGTSQPYAVGDFVRKSDPAEVTAAGATYLIIGYICTVAGSPGTWEECRVLTADLASVPVTVADAASDTTTWPMLAGSQTGAQQPLSDAGLTYNASTNVLTATGGFTGDLTGNVTGNVTGNAGTVTWANEATDTTCFVGFATAASGSLAPKTNANMTFNSSTGVVTFASSVLTTTDINGGTIDGTAIGGSSASTGAFSTISATGQITSTLGIGTAPFAITSTTKVNNLHVARATLADTVTVADTTDASCNIAMFESATGDMAAKTDAALTYNATTGSLSATLFAVGANQVLTARQTGWGTPSSTLLRTTYATYAGTTFANSTYSGLFTDLQTLDDVVKGLSQRLGALITDLVTHGMIGA